MILYYLFIGGVYRGYQLQEHDDGFFWSPTFISVTKNITWDFSILCVSIHLAFLLFIAWNMSTPMDA